MNKFELEMHNNLSMLFIIVYPYCSLNTVLQLSETNAICCYFGFPISISQMLLSIWNEIL